MITERTLPHSLQAEKAVLGAILVNPDHLDDLPALQPAAFFRAAHQMVFEALRDLRQRGVGIDFVTVTEELRRRGRLDECGGPAYVASLTEGMPRSTNAPHYADVVTAHATRRAVIHLANRLMVTAYEAEAEPSALVDDAQRAVLALAADTAGGGPVPASALLPATLQALEAAHDGHRMVTGVASGLADLDELTMGFQRKDLILLAGRPSMGKTSLMLNIAAQAALRAGQHVLCFSLEMSKEQLMLRLASSEARISSYRMRSGYLNEREYARIGQAMAELHGAALYIDDTPALAVGDMAARARRHKIQHGRLDLVLVDYLQLMTVRERHENRNQEVSAVSRALKATAKELDVPVVALSQLSRRPDDRRDKRPILSDLRESGSLEQDADLVLFVHREADSTTGGSENEGVAEVILAKNRNGPIGTARVVWLADVTRFENLATGA